MLHSTLIKGFLMLSLAKYGYTKSTYIVGGKDTTIQEHPYQVALLWNGNFICSGSLISQNLVLTAAQCTFESARSYSVRIGSDYANLEGTVINAKDVYIHPQYAKDGKIDYDVSLIKLEQDVELSDDVAIIKIPEADAEVPVDALAEVTGWGMTQEGGTPSKKLKVVEVPKLSNKDCKEMYALLNNSITPREICFGYKEGGKDCCQGDSGGPLTWNGTQVGTVSWGVGCARKNSPGVYANLADPEINKFIKNYLN